MKSIIIAAVLVLFAVSLFAAKNYALGLVFIAVAILILVRWWKSKAGKRSATPKSTKASTARPTPQAPAATPATAPQPTPIQQRRASAGVINFKIKGVTFEDRQEVLQGIDEMEDERYIACTYGIDQTTFEGRPAVTVYAQLSDDDMTEKVLGFVPKEMVQDVLQVYDKVFDVDVDVYGGQDGKSYGAAATLYYDK